MNSKFEVKVPFENVNDPSAKLLSWAVPSGGIVKEGDIIAELENSKTSFQVFSPIAGKLEYSILAEQEVSAGDTLCYVVSDVPVGGKPELPDSEKTEVPASSPAVAGARIDEPVPSAGAVAPVFSQKAMRLINELGLECDQFASYTMARETDVREKFASLQNKNLPIGGDSPIEVKEVATPPSNPASAEVDKVPLERSKILENRELGAANSSALKSTIYFWCKAAGFRDACLKHSPPIDRLSVILFEVVKLLTSHRYLNAYYQESCAFLYRNVHVGFAVDIDRGLKVLVIRNANDLTFPQLAAKVEELLVKYSTNTLATEDVTGSTFTVTDLSQEGVFAFEPLINNRQAAILAIAAEQGQSGLAGFMLGCTFDHRLTSGRVVAEFLGELSSRLVGHAQSIRKNSSVEPQPCCSRCFSTIDQLRMKDAFLVPSVEPVGFICSLCFDGY